MLRVASVPAGGGGGGGSTSKALFAATCSAVALLLLRTYESKRGRRAKAQRSSTHRRLGSAPRVLARVSSRRELLKGKDVTGLLQNVKPFKCRSAADVVSQ